MSAPTAVGWYWLKHEDGYKEIVEVIRSGIGDLLAKSGREAISVAVLEMKGVEWSEQIPNYWNEEKKS
jgi:hypothetical protein